MTVEHGLPKDMADTFVVNDPLLPNPVPEDPWEEALFLLDSNENTISERKYWHLVQKGEIEGHFPDTGGYNYFVRSLGNLGLIPESRKIKLIAKAQAGKIEARDELLLGNLRLVNFVAQRYFKKTDIPDAELFSNGLKGLQNAIGIYDPRRGAKFTTLAVRCIKQAMYNSLWGNRVIRVAPYAEKKIDRVARARLRLEAKKSGPYTANDLASETKLTTDIVKTALLFESTVIDPLPLDGSEVDLNEEDLSEIGIYHDFKRQIKTLIDNPELELRERDKLILELRYGIGQRNGMTLEQVGKVFGITRERVRQIEEEVFKKIRESGVTIEDFREYFD